MMERYTLGRWIASGDQEWGFVFIRKEKFMKGNFPIMRGMESV